MFEARTRVGLVQIDVKKALDIAQSTLSELETTANSSGRTTEFARLYRCDANWLATGAGDPAWDQDQPSGAHAAFPIMSLHMETIMDFLTLDAARQVAIADEIRAEATAKRAQIAAPSPAETKIAPPTRRTQVAAITQRMLDAQRKKDITMEADQARRPVERKRK